MAPVLKYWSPGSSDGLVSGRTDSDGEIAPAAASVPSRRPPRGSPPPSEVTGLQAPSEVEVDSDLEIGAGPSSSDSTRAEPMALPRRPPECVPPGPLSATRSLSLDSVCSVRTEHMSEDEDEEPPRHSPISLEIPE